MSVARSVALAGVAGVVLGSLTLGVAFPASADTISPLFPNSSNAADYALSVRGQDIFSAQSAASKAAWTPELGRVAATNANIYRAAQVYGNLDPAQLGEVIPMNQAVDRALNGKLTAGMVASNGVSAWKGTGFRFPRFPTSPLTAVRGALGSPLVATVGIAAFMQRADIANGVTSWVGIDATGSVCSDPVAGGHNFVNWVTGQDCDQWRAAQDFVPNFGTVPKAAGWVGSEYYWGASKAPVLLHAVGSQVTPGSPQAGSFSYSIDYSIEPYTSSQQAPVWNAICMTSTGRFEATALDGGPQGGAAGVVRTITFDCGLGNKLYALGRVTPPSAAGAYSVQGSVDRATGQPYFFNNPSTDLAYLTPLSPAYQPAVAGNPDRQIQCTQYGASGAVTNGYTTAVTEETIKVSGMPAPVCLPLPNAENPNRVVLTETGGGESNVYYDKTQTDAATNWDANYSADCGSGVSQHTCLLDLVQTSNGISCFSSTANCADWMSDPARDSKYQCQYGGKSEAVNQCYVYANVFDAAKRAAGNPYADPKTGEDTGKGTGSDLDTQTMGNPAGAVIQPNGSVTSCWGGGSPGAFNPVGWIVRGGQCLLNWAFVPRPLVVKSQMEAVSTGWQSNGIGKLVTAVGSWRISPVVSGCSSSLPFPVPMIHKTITVPIIQACPGTPMGDFAPWVRALVSAGLIVTAGFAVKRIVAGWIPS